MRRALLIAALLGLPVLGHCSSDDEPGGGSTVPLGGNGGSGEGGSGGTGADGGMGAFVFGGAPSTGGEPDAGGPDSGIDDAGCGNARIEAGEICDDGNSVPGDGCAADCLVVENGFVCPTPGQACVSTLVCGDSRIGGEETCDDGNETSSDGCSSTCAVETGWICPVPGTRCQAAACGDGLIIGREQCEDGDDPPAANDGCDDTCRLEPGFACDSAGTACRATVCNDGTKEGSEPCDDGNLVIGDGCNPFCEVEPDCTLGACVSACGDRMILPGDSEQCDDGNTQAGDGCSPTCQTEDGFTCTQVTGDLPDELIVPVTYRDFNRSPTATGTKHPDFETYSGSDATPGLVEQALGGNGKPVYTGLCEAGNLTAGSCPEGEQTTTQADFDQWYSDTHPVDLTFVTTMTLTRVGTTEQYRTAPGQLLPIDDQGLVAALEENEHDGHNFGFTSEIRTWFEFKGDEQLDFSGDDDVWVFIAGQLVLDLGGLHPQRSGSFVLNADGTATWTRLMESPDPAITDAGSLTETGTVDLGLEVGRVYEIVLFHAERHTGQSNFQLTLAGFTKTSSECTSNCGDGVVVGDEVCDDGVNDGSYGSCLPGCVARGPFCGDGTLQASDEACDDGINLTTYSSSGAACAPGCQPSATCGDSQVDSLFGEVCDDGTNDGGYGECEPGCVLGPRCGDGTLQAEFGETCDDGNTVSADECSMTCKREVPR